jgi:RNA polymerase sigma-70 factor (ECF subfamily)
LDDEQSIIERAKRDPEQFGVLFERHYPSIFAYIHRRVADWDAANDLAAEVFLKAFKGLWKYRWQGVPFSAWLYRIATNENQNALPTRRPPIAFTRATERGMRF